MTHFENLYQILLTDPNYGKISHRKEQFRKMYVEGMNKCLDVLSNRAEEPAMSIILDLIDEESK